MSTRNRHHRVIGHSPSCRVLLAFFVLALTACQKQADKSAIPPEKVTIACSVLISAALVHIAWAKGFFAAEGLDVDLQRHAFGKLALQSVNEGKADLATVAETPFMFSVLDGNDIRIISIIETTPKNSAIVARKDRGIMHPADLNGKTVGVTAGTTSQFFFDAYIATHGIDVNSVKTVDLKPEDMHDALVGGRIDAASAWNPVIHSMVKTLKENSVAFYDETLYSEIFTIAGRQEFVRNRSEAVRKVLLALLRAEAFAERYPKESQAIVAEFMGADPALVGEMWAETVLKVSLDQSLLVALENETRWAIRNGLTKSASMPNYVYFIHFDALNAVKPKAVRIIR